jgi:heme-degrading monooxygenase HmoA
VIARVWTARTTRAQAPAYAEYLRAHVLPSLRSIAGYERALLLERESGDTTELQVITFWESLDAIRAFAGSDIEEAVVTDTAAALLTDYDRRTRHFRVVLSDYFAR